MQTADEYVASLIVGTSAKRKRLKAIKLMFELLAERGHERPDDTDYEEYSRRSEVSETSTKQNMSYVKEYFAAQAEGSEQLTMLDGLQGAGANEVPETEHDKEPKAGNVRAGRSRLDKERGEVRSEKLMLYLTPTMIADIRDWCRLKGISAVSYITDLVSADMAGKCEKLKFFREFSNEA